MPNFNHSDFDHDELILFRNETDFSFVLKNETDSNPISKNETFTGEFTLEKLLIKIRPIVGACLFAISCIGTLANFSVLCCAWKIFRTLNRNVISNYLHQYFIISMTVADLAFVGVYTSAMFAQYSLSSLFNVYSCGFVYFVCHTSTVASTLSLLCLNVDKFVAVIRPLHHSSIVTKSRVWIAISLCWIISIIWALIFVTTMINVSLENCGFLIVSFEHYCVFTVVFFILPILCSAVLSVIVGSIACGSSGATTAGPCSQIAMHRLDIRTGKRRREGNVNYMKISKRISVSVSNSDSTRSNRYRLAISRFRTLIFVFATTAWSFLTCLPYRVMYLFYLTMTTEDRLRFMPVSYGLFTLMTMNPLGNPIITFITQWRYRKVMTDAVRRIYRSGDLERDTSQPIRYQTWSSGRYATGGSEIEYYGQMARRIN